MRRASCAATANGAAAATSSSWVFDDAHPAAYDVPTRLAVMDEIGIWAQIVYPNVAGFGGQKLSPIEDPGAPACCP